MVTLLRRNDQVATARSSLVVFLCLAMTMQLPGNPAGEVVRFGDVAFERQGDTLRIIQGSQSGIINWDSFSIATGETTQFIQPNSLSATLNRVTGQSVSNIDGRLLANGRVFLLNSNGIVIGRDGSIDVAGFAASTLDVSDNEFLSGGDLNFRGPSQAAIVNLGSISAFDGDIFLVAATVDNSGSLRAPAGTVGLAAGNEVLIKESGSERVYVRGANGGRKENGVINKGTVEANVAELKAHGGNIYGVAVKNEGRVAATGVTRQGGQIFLSAGGGNVRSTGTLKAKRTDGSGGKIKVDSGAESRAEIGGTVDASGGIGRGGEIAILGNEIEVFEGALILNDGAITGGTTYIGGGLRGRDPEFANAEDVTVGNGAIISANSIGSGNGGQVVVFAEDTLHFHGTLSVRGGTFGGNGGFAELSGKHEVYADDLVRQVLVSAPAGKAGTLLLDPIDVAVIDGVGGGVSGTSITDGAINSFLSGGSLIINTSGTGGDGDISLASNVNISWDTDNNLSFFADQDFKMTGGAVINATGDGDFSATAIRMITLGNLARITTVNGNLDLSANQQMIATSGSFIGVNVNGGTIQSTGTGVVTVSGRGGDAAAMGQTGVSIMAGGQILGGTADGSLTITGTGRGSGNFGFHYGVRVGDDTSRISSLGAPVSVTGQGGSGSNWNAGVYVHNNGVITSGGSGSVTVTGTAGNGDDANHGVALFNGGVITSDSGGDGPVLVTGTAGSNSSPMAEGYGVFVYGSGSILTSGLGNVVVNGYGGVGGRRSFGVYLENSGVINSGGGSVVVTGEAGAIANPSGFHGGVALFHEGSMITSGGGDVSVIGFGSTGGDEGYGVLLNQSGLITAGGSGFVSVIGTGGTAGTFSNGVAVYGASDIASNGGLLMVSGFAGTVTNTSALSSGVRINSSGSINSGSGNVVVLGTGGVGSNGKHHGVVVEGFNSSIRSLDGDLFVTGIGGNAGSGNRGIFVRGTGSISTSGAGSITLDGVGTSFGIAITEDLGAGASVTTMGSGDITLITDAFTIDATEFIDAGSNTVTIHTKSNGFAINLGGSDHIDSDLGLSDEELDRITAGLVQIGNIDSGDITVSGAISHGNHLSFSTGSGVTINQAITMATGKNLSIETFDGTYGGISLSSMDANLSTAGTGTISLTTPRDIFLSQGSSITSTTGTITLSANALGSTPGNFVGIMLDGATITSTTGDVILKGTGGDFGNGGYGIGLATGSLVELHGGNVDLFGSNISLDASSITNTGTGTIDLDAEWFIDIRNNSLLSVIDGNLTINANAGRPLIGDFTAIDVENSSLLTTGLGDIALTGRGGDGLFGEPSGSRGIRLYNGTTLSSAGTMTGAGGIALHGEGGDGNYGYEGIYLAGSTTSITSENGAISLTGIGGDSNDGGSIGILMVENATIHSTGLAPNAATITLHGTGGGIGSYNTGVFISDYSTGIHSAYGDILITGIGGGDGEGMSNYGIRLQNIYETIASTGAGTDAAKITLHGTGGDGFFDNDGVSIVGEVTISSVDGAISITGLGGSGGDGDHQGIRVSEGTAITGTGLADITLDGTGGSGHSFNEGVLMQGAGSTITSVDGLVKIKGQGGGTVDGFGNRGIRVIGSTIQSTGVGDVELTGTGGLGSSWIDGIQFEDGALVSVVDGASVIEGVAGGTLGIGVMATGGGDQGEGGGGQGGFSAFVIAPVSAGGDILATGTGSVTITGSGMNAPGVDLSEGFIGGENAAFVTVESLDNDLRLRSSSSADGDIKLLAAGDAFIDGAVASGNGDVEISGYNVTINQQVSALTGDIKVQIGSGEDSVDSGGTAAINADLLRGGMLRFTGGTGSMDTVTYAGYGEYDEDDVYIGPAVSFDISDLDSIEYLIGSSSTGDGLMGPSSSSVYEFDGPDAFAVEGVSVSSFENLFAGSGADLFHVSSGGLTGHLSGGRGIDTLDYSEFGSPVTVDIAYATASGFGGINGLEKFKGSAGVDTFLGSSGDDTFNITAANAGRLNGVTDFASFENLGGGSGADYFRFLNQATVGSIDGGDDFDILDIDDRNLGGVNTYTITTNRISRNPSYLFSGIEGLQLLLGPGNDTVVSGGNGLVQNLNGGGGFDTLNLGPGVFLTGSPILIGGSSIFHTGFEGPTPGNANSILTNQTGNVPQPDSGPDSSSEDQYTLNNGGSGQDAAKLLQALGAQGGNAFAAALAGQAVVIQIDGQQFLLGAPASLDGTFSDPPAGLLRQLRENLSAGGWSELADAIDFEGSMILVSSDGSFAIDLSGTAPAEIAALLGENLAPGSTQELFAALEMAIFIPITSADGVVAILAVPIQPDPALLALLNELLNEQAFTELTGALDTQ